MDKAKVLVYNPRRETYEEFLRRARLEANIAAKEVIKDAGVIIIDPRIAEKKLNTKKVKSEF